MIGNIVFYVLLLFFPSLSNNKRMFSPPHKLSQGVYFIVAALFSILDFHHLLILSLIAELFGYSVHTGEQPDS